MNLTIERLDPLPVIAGLIQDLGLTEKIDARKAAQEAFKARYNRVYELDVAALIQYKGRGRPKGG